MLNVQVGGNHCLAREQVLLFTCAVMCLYAKGQLWALGCLLRVQAMSQVWKAASLQQGSVWWGTALGGVSQLCKMAMGKSGTPGDATQSLM